MIDYTHKQLNILAVMAYPDDMFDYCAGTLAHHIKRGDKVTVASVMQGLKTYDLGFSDGVFFSGGGYGEDEARTLRATRSEIKSRKAINACKTLGISDVRFLGIEDKINLVNEPDIIKIAKLIREVKPDILITHYPNSNMGIGKCPQVGKMIVHAMQFAGSIDFEDPESVHKTPQLLFALPDNNTVTCLDSGKSYVCDIHIDVSDVAEDLEKAKSCLNGPKNNENKTVEITFKEKFMRYYPETTYYLHLPRKMQKSKNITGKETRKEYMIESYI